MSICVVTGAAGFIGSHLTERLLADGHEVRGIDCFTDYYDRAIKERNLAGARAHKNFTLFDQDLRSADYSKLLQGAEFVFHQGGQAGVRPSWGKNFSKYVECNITATQALIEACVGSPSLKRFVFASTSSAYGQAEQFPTSEKILPKPVSPYGVTKLAAEHLCHLYHSQMGVPVTSLRYFTVFGPRQRPDMAFTIFCTRAIKGESIVIFGDGEQTRDFTFVADIVDANIKAALSPQAVGEMFNLGGGEIVSVNQVLDILKELNGGTLNVEYRAPNKGEARNTCADTSKARAMINYTPQYSVRRGLTLQYQWVQELHRQGQLA